LEVQPPGLLAGPQPLAWFAPPSTLALIPQITTGGLPALIGIEMIPPPPGPLLLPWLTGAQALDWPAPPRTLPLMPQTAIGGLPALTGAEITPDPCVLEPPLVLVLPWLTGAQVFD
jgi:hypothetical protein